VAALGATFASVSKLKADLTRLVKSPDRVGGEHGLRAGRLDRGALTRAAIGREDCFSTREYIDGQNAAVAVVLDNSSSMGGKNKSLYARAMALAIGDALDRAAVPFEISKAGIGTEMSVLILKGYSQSWRARRALLGNGGLHSGTCNLVGAESAANRLAAVKGVTRRLLFVLSDGADMYGDQEWLLAQRLWARRGIETIGVGLLHDVSDCFPLSVTVRAPEDVTRAGLGVLARKLKAPGLAA
jgi:cobalamin biosynthesis protein CobT